MKLQITQIGDASSGKDLNISPTEEIRFFFIFFKKKNKVSRKKQRANHALKWRVRKNMSLGLRTALCY